MLFPSATMPILFAIWLTYSKGVFKIQRPIFSRKPSHTPYSLFPLGLQPHSVFNICKSTWYIQGNDISSLESKEIPCPNSSRCTFDQLGFMVPGSCCSLTLWPSQLHLMNREAKETDCYRSYLLCAYTILGPTHLLSH